MEYVDEEMEPDPGLNRVTNLIIGAAIAVHSELGAGFDENTYCNALEMEFKARGIAYVREYPVHVMYRGAEVGVYRLDFLVENSVVLEIKSVTEIAPIHVAQAISYLHATRFKLALIINFNVKLLKQGVKRIAC
ncbi:MAG TPA: GxxExxY protein [Tepidisphaeraceae bacterium]|jgi:GxxExxY protein|nr:GxxExxY protein [Tepidisphaeraceae bacterium]